MMTNLFPWSNYIKLQCFLFGMFGIFFMGTLIINHRTFHGLRRVFTISMDAAFRRRAGCHWGSHLQWTSKPGELRSWIKGVTKKVGDSGWSIITDHSEGLSPCMRHKASLIDFPGSKNRGFCPQNWRETARHSCHQMIGNVMISGSNKRIFEQWN